MFILNKMRSKVVFSRFYDFTCSLLYFFFHSLIQGNCRKSPEKAFVHHLQFMQSTHWHTICSVKLNK